MNAPTYVLSFREELLDILRSSLEIDTPLEHCASIELLEERIAEVSPHAVVVHLASETMGDYSPGRFVAKLDELVEHCPIYALVEPECPARLRSLGERLVEESMVLPIDSAALALWFAPSGEIESQIKEFHTQLPSREIIGTKRSLVTFTPDMFEMMEEVKIAARHDVTVLLVGETGSGKTHLAHLLHEMTPRRDEPFCTVACGALPLNLIESELFGAVKGAYTGADRDREGKFAAAGKGTLLLDEIDVLPVDQQAKLLRVIETGEYEKVGSNKTIKSEARLVVASNYDLESLVRAGTFRTDLYYRLNVINFQLLPLRERPWDIEFLARTFAIAQGKQHGITIRSIEPEFLAALRRYPWPGNIRELENVIRRAVLYCQRGILTVGDLPGAVRSPVAVNLAPSSTTRPPLPPPLGLPAENHLLSVPHQRESFALPEELHSPSRQLTGAIHAQDSLSSGEMPVAQRTLESRVGIFEQQVIQDSLVRNNQRRKQTAADLGISRVTLYNKMKKFGLLGA